MLNEKKSKRGTVIALLCALALLALVILLENTMKPTGMLFTVLKKGAVYALVAVSMNLLNGFTGLFSLGQAGFMLLGVEKIVMMSGLPAGCPGDKTPVWITTSWPPETQDILDYQWNEVAIPKWKELVRMAADCGIRQIALENHGMQLVYNPETLFRLREAVGPMVGMNLDPSHLFWMGGDPIEAARVLGEQNALYHVHGKDSRPERRMSGPNGLLDTKPIDQFRTRSWNYVAVGCGHGAQWWKEFFSTVRMAGYDGDVSLEMEDLTMPMLEGHLTSLRVLKEALVL